jgi:hypothetical protein
MDLDDLFDRDRHRGTRGHRDHDEDDGHDEGRYRQHRDPLIVRGQYAEHDRRREHPERYHGHDDDDGLPDLSRIAQRLLANKKLLMLAAVVLLAVVALAAVFLLPLLGQVIDYLDKHGIKGVIDRVWQGLGSGK